MAEYADFYEERFRRNLDVYAHIRDRLERKVSQILRLFLLAIDSKVFFSDFDARLRHD